MPPALAGGCRAGDGEAVTEATLLFWVVLLLFAGDAVAEEGVGTAVAIDGSAEAVGGE